MFDADGVLVHAEMFSLQLERKYGITHEQVRPFYTGVFNLAMTGEADLREIIEPFLQEWGWSGSVDDFLQEWFEYEHVLDEEFLNNIQKLRAKGFKCYVATNQEKYRAQYMIDKMGFGDSFDKVFASAHLGVQKPDQLYYQKILEETGANKDEVLFWDDLEKNIVGAKKFGIHAEVFENVEQFKKVMKEKYEIDV